MDRRRLLQAAATWPAAGLAGAAGAGDAVAGPAPGRKVLRVAFPAPETGFDPVQTNSDQYSSIVIAQILENVPALQTQGLNLEIALARQHTDAIKAVGDYQLTQAKLARMAVIIQASRQFSYDVARLMAKGEGQLEASLVKAYVCKAAEWVTREAMQIHGGMGYAEEYDVSRYFVDARVLSIFEGADETLCLKVIARRLVETHQNS